MKISKIIAYKRDLGNKKPYTIAFKTVDEVYNAFVEIELENGLIGVGAGNPSEYVVGENLESTMKALDDEHLDFLIGRDIRHMGSILYDIQENFPNNPAARAALDIALHDVFTKWMEVPLASYLGLCIDSLPTSVTIGIKNVSDTLVEADEYLALGFRVLKVKTGTTVEEDIERIVKLRAHCGRGVKIRVDANQGYTTKELVQFFDATQNANVEFIEQPLPAKSIAEMKKVPEHIKKSIAIDESLISPSDAMVMASSDRAGDIFNIKLMKSGGILPGQQIASIAHASGIDLMWGCNDESIVSISAALHLALSFPNTKYLDLDGSLDLLEDIVEGGFKIKDGWMSITSEPGLGVKKI